MKTILTILAMVIVTVANAQNIDIQSNRYDQNLRIMESMRQAGTALEQAGEAGNQVLFLGVIGSSVGIIVLATSAAPVVGIVIITATLVFVLVKTIIKNNKLKKAGRKLKGR